MKQKIITDQISGEKRIKIVKDSEGLTLYLKQYGNCLSGNRVDEEMLDMIQISISKYYEQKYLDRITELFDK